MNGVNGRLVATLEWIIATYSVLAREADHQDIGKHSQKKTLESMSFLKFLATCLFRYCNDPAPRYGGHPCSGPSYQYSDSCYITIFDPYPGLSTIDPLFSHLCSQIVMDNHWTMVVAMALETKALVMFVSPGMDTAPLMTSVPQGQDVAPTTVLWSTLMLFPKQTAVRLSVKPETRQ